MTRILLIETSTAKLSVALAADGNVIASRECSEPRQQASLTAPLVKEVLDSQGLKVTDCNAICVSKGPGSYTGLRVGVSTAKGLAFGAGLPLLAVGTLDILAQAAREIAGQAGNDATVMPGPDRASFIIPMIDARRMEVYTAVFSPSGEQLTPVSAQVIGPESFAEQLEQGPVLFIGDGALKCREVITHPSARFMQAWPDAAHMARLAQEAWDQKRFEDLAYFEPFYLKDFVATVSRKSVFPQNGTI
ncbi:MAG: tRNA (adenosine(37)-N6)-threonylcarbamoyltransferase complex dimerization subunit type 1 TsaB [Bacteroidales bacterium]|nr:tRNA (adenosine(37)-N6)-threonylcarbamoyltransferase complex dimerization subunit type 1 TsaB [Bacteroidales bacterium]